MQSFRPFIPPPRRHARRRRRHIGSKGERSLVCRRLKWNAEEREAAGIKRGGGRAVTLFSLLTISAGFTCARSRPPHFSLQHYPRIRTTRGNLFERIWARRAEDCRVSFLISYSNSVCKEARRLRRDTPSKQIRAQQAHEEGERKGLRMFKCPACTAEAASRLLSPVLRKHQKGEGRGVPKVERGKEKR